MNFTNYHQYECLWIKANLTGNHCQFDNYPRRNLIAMYFTNYHEEQTFPKEPMERQKRMVAQKSGWVESQNG